VRHFFILGWLLVSFTIAGRGQVIYSENFENVANNALPAGWYGSATTPGSWKTGHNTDFLLPGNGYPPEHTKFLGLKLDSNWEHIVRMDTLMTPNIPLQNAQVYNYPTLYMDLYYIPFINDDCSVDMSFDGGNVWFNVYYDLPTRFWEPMFITLPQFVNQSSVKFRFIHKVNPDGQIGGLYMDNIKLYDQAAVDASVYDVSPHNDSIYNYASATQGDSLKVSIVNMTSNTINDAIIKYSVANGPVHADTFTSLNLTGFTTKTLTHQLPATAPGMSSYQVKAWVEVTGDGDHTNDTGTTTLIGAAFIPNKIPLIEERGGTWCGWCIRGLFFNDSLARKHPEASIVSVHNWGPSPDPMAVPMYDTFMGHMHIHGTEVSIFGFPVIIADRRELNDPLYTIDEYERDEKYFGYGSLTLGPSIINNNHLSIDVHFTPAINMNGNYKLALVLEEDSVHKDSIFYDQTNAYSYMISNTPFYGYEALPSPIPAAQMYYDFVARAILPNPLGATGSLPTTMSYNSTYSYTFQTTLDTAWKKEKMKVVAMLLRASDTFVLNTVNHQLLTPVEVKAVEGTVNVEVFPNPANEEINVRAEAAGVTPYNIVIRDMNGRVVLERNYGPDKRIGVSLPVNHLAPGIYYLQLKTDQGTTNKLITITR